MDPKQDITWDLPSWVLGYLSLPSRKMLRVFLLESGDPSERSSPNPCWGGDTKENMEEQRQEWFSEEIGKNRWNHSKEGKIHPRSSQIVLSVLKGKVYYAQVDLALASVPSKKKAARQIQLLHWISFDFQSISDRLRRHSWFAFLCCWKNKANIKIENLK